MPNDNTAVSRATDALYAAFEAIAPILRADQGANDLQASRQRYMSAMHYLAVHVCDADGQLSAAEAVAISDIFWLDQLGWDNWNICDLLAREPQHIEASLAELERLACMASENAAHLDPPQGTGRNIILEAAELVFHTALAADASSDLEVGRLSKVTSRLRHAAFPQEPCAPPVSVPSVSVPSALAATDGDSVASILAQLDRLVGLHGIKAQVETLTNLARVFAIRREMGLPVPDMSFHLVFLGNPGTGKTTVARIVAKLYGKLGLLSKGHLVEVDRSGLVASYIGQTATKVQGVIEQALGGVLFIDEAYALNGEHATDFGHEAVATLLKAMEDHRSNLVVIAAGYTDNMHKFLNMNPGLKSRMSRDLVFDDYTPFEMVAIFRGMAAQHQYAVPGDWDAMLVQLFTMIRSSRGTDFGNARDVRNLFERVVDAQANRLATMAAPTTQDLTTIIVEDLKAAAGPTNTAPQPV